MAVESLGKKRRKRRKRDALDGSTFKLQRTVAVHSDKFGVGITEEDAKNTEKNSIPESEGNNEQQ